MQIYNGKRANRRKESTYSLKRKRILENVLLEPSPVLKKMINLKKILSLGYLTHKRFLDRKQRKTNL